jgi:CO/xanthine dehydrogenase Mo-binding subunit
MAKGWKRRLRRLPIELQPVLDAMATPGIFTASLPTEALVFGIKSAGEGGITPVGAVIASAIDDAIGIPGGVTQLPATPQRVKALLRTARRQRAVT